MTTTWWRWLGTTGCFAGKGLLLALSTVPASAQQPQPPTTGCFKVEMSHSTQGTPRAQFCSTVASARRGCCSA